MPKLQHVKKTDNYTISVPKELVNKKGWKKGEKLFWMFNERGNVELLDEEKTKR